MMPIGPVTSIDGNGYGRTDDDEGSRIIIGTGGDSRCRSVEARLRSVVERIQRPTISAARTVEKAECKKRNGREMWWARRDSRPCKHLARGRFPNTFETN